MNRIKKLMTINLTLIVLYPYIWILINYLLNILLSVPILSSIFNNYFFNLVLLSLKWIFWLEVVLFYKVLGIFLAIHSKNVFRIFYYVYFLDGLYNYNLILSRIDSFSYVSLDLMELSSYCLIRLILDKDNQDRDLLYTVIRISCLRIFHIPYVLLSWTISIILDPTMRSFSTYTLRLAAYRDFLYFPLYKKKLTFERDRVILNGFDRMGWSSFIKQSYYGFNLGGWVLSPSNNKNVFNKPMCFTLVRRGDDPIGHFESPQKYFNQTIKLTNNCRGGLYGDRVGILYGPFIKPGGDALKGGFIIPNNSISLTLQKSKYLYVHQLYHSIYLDSGRVGAYRLLLKSVNPEFLSDLTVVARGCYRDHYALEQKLLKDRISSEDLRELGEDRELYFWSNFKNL